MAKNKNFGIANTLAEQAKERFNTDSPTKPVTQEKTAPVAESNEKIRKNFYIEPHLVKLLRRMAYEKETDQTKIVNEALEAFFKSHDYM